MSGIALLFRTLTNRNFALYWCSWLLGQIVQASILFALTLQAYELTHNEATAGLAISFYTVPGSPTLRVKANLHLLQVRENCGQTELGAPDSP